MLKIKKRYGLTFPDLEKKGWLEVILIIIY
jgi:hypothetical protein